MLKRDPFQSYLSFSNFLFGRYSTHVICIYIYFLYASLVSFWYETNPGLGSLPLVFFFFIIFPSACCLRVPSPDVTPPSAGRIGRKTRSRTLPNTKLRRRRIHRPFPPQLLNQSLMYVRVFFFIIFCQISSHKYRTTRLPPRNPIPVYEMFPVRAVYV